MISEWFWGLCAYAAIWLVAAFLCGPIAASIGLAIFAAIDFGSQYIVRDAE